MLIFFALLALTTEALLLNHSLGLLIVLQVIFGLAMAMLYSASLYYSMHLGRGSARQAGIHEAVIGAGTTVGPALAALAGAANALPPKALAIFLVLLCGGSAMGILAAGARGLVRPLPAPAPRGERHAEA
jgi:MFS family permease